MNIYAYILYNKLNLFVYNLANNVKMDAGFSSYHNGGPAREQDFGKLSQTIGTSILKISQNGEY